MFFTTKPASRRASQVETGLRPRWSENTAACIRRWAEGAGLDRNGTEPIEWALTPSSHLGISTLRHAITVRAGLPAQTDSQH